MKAEKEHFTVLLDITTPTMSYLFSFEMDNDATYGQFKQMVKKVAGINVRQCKRNRPEEEIKAKKNLREILFSEKENEENKSERILKYKRDRELNINLAYQPNDDLTEFGCHKGGLIRALTNNTILEKMSSVIRQTELQQATIREQKKPLIKISGNIVSRFLISFDLMILSSGITLIAVGALMTYVASEIASEEVSMAAGSCISVGVVAIVLSIAVPVILTGACLGIRC